MKLFVSARARTNSAVKVEIILNDVLVGNFNTPSAQANLPQESHIYLNETIGKQVITQGINDLRIDPTTEITYILKMCILIEYEYLA